MQRTKRTIRYGWMFLGLGIGLLGLASMSEAQWTEKAPMLESRCYFSSSAVDGIIYAIGGAVDESGNTPALATVEAYDPATDTWTEKAPMLTPRGGLSTSVVDGIIYAIGGSNQRTLLSTVEAYDPATDAWIEKAPMPAPKWYFSTSVVDGIIYAMGGVEELVDNPDPMAALRSSTPMSTVFAYDPATDTWTEKEPMLTARDWFSSSAVDGQIYTMGGGTMG